jgi:membrane-associated protease RseP (regulator of RpoE activity)
MNFLAAVLAMMVISWSYGISKGVKVVEVTPESPAYAAQIKEGDEILRVNGKSVEVTDRFGIVVYENRGRNVDVEIRRGDETKIVKVAIRGEAPEGQGLLGVIYSPREIYQPSLFARPFVHFYYGFVATVYLSK